MELRSTRSRSKTPFLQHTEAFIEGETFAEANHVSVTRTTRKNTVVRSSASSIKSKGKSVKALSAIKTSDYSSEEGEIENVCHLSQNEKNQILEDARKAANGSAEVSALTLYRRAGRYWDKYPKTDYTYSPHSRDRVEIAPGVVQMPNMSRPTIHSSTNTEAWDEYASSVRQKLFSRINNNATEEDFEEDETFKIHRRHSSRIVTIFTSVCSFVIWCFYSVYRAHNSSFIWLGKKLHHFVSWVMLLDTWLLMKNTGENRKLKSIIALCLFPLLFFAGLWLLTSLCSAIYTSLLSPSNQQQQQQQEVPPLITTHIPQTTPPTEVNLDEIVAKLLQSPQISNLNINSQDDRNKVEELSKIVASLKDEIEKFKIVTEEKDSDLKMIVSRVAYLTQRINRCCNNKQIINLAPHITNVFGKLLNDPEFLSNQKGFSDYLNNLFVAKDDLEWRLKNITESHPKNLEISIEDTANVVMEKVTSRLNKNNIKLGYDSDEEKIKAIVQSSLAIYDADKTGLVDYAMEPMGGQIITTRCTESYHAGTAVVSIMGVPLWYPTNSPRIAITPGINPGECWAFQNFPGFIVIKLANRIKVEAFSLEHISRLLVPDGRIDSAPKEFEVYGLEEENDKNPVLIGEYVYDYDGDSLQFFAAHKAGLVFSMIEVRIKSNHGNPNYTCLYRFRVHGKVT